MATSPYFSLKIALPTPLQVSLRLLGRLGSLSDI